MYLLKIVVLFSLDKYSVVELLEHMVVLFLIFQGTSILFLIVATPVYISTNGAWEFPFFHILCRIFVPYIFDTILAARKWYLIVVLIYISLMMIDVGYLSVYLLAIWMSSLEKYLLRSFVHLLIGLFVCVCMCVYVFYLFFCFGVFFDVKL